MFVSSYKALSTEEAIEIPLLDPDGRPAISEMDGTPVKLFLLPPRAPSIARRIEEITEKKELLSEEGELTQEKRERLVDEQLSVYLAGWTENWAWEEGDSDPVKFSRANAVRFVAEMPGVREYLWQWGTDGGGKAWRALKNERSSGRAGEGGSTDRKKADKAGAKS